MRGSEDHAEEEEEELTAEAAVVAVAAAAVVVAAEDEDAMETVSDAWAIVAVAVAAAIKEELRVRESERRVGLQMQAFRTGPIVCSHTVYCTS
jgi:hypothetical protein